ncbi:Protein kinase [Aphelenchoides avenae]|nr:Protein kinase [Aphelenchus avenae]
MSIAKVPTLFKCVKCGKEYNKRSSLREHMETHNGKLHECNQCEKKYKWRAALRTHKRTAHAEAGRFECDKCDKICPHKRALDDHKRKCHSDRKFECPVCGKPICPGNESRHMETHSGQACECDVCGTMHRNPPALAQHKRREHSKAKHRGEYYGKTFGRASILRKHVAVHDEEHEEHRCGRCSRTFKSRSGRDRHLRTEHSDFRFNCDSKCGLNSATRTEYLDHLRSRHAKQHPATCKCVFVDAKVAQQVATKLGSTAFVEADETMKCTDGGCDFATTCARQIETHKEQCHHDAYQPALRCVRCETWFTCPSNLRSHDADMHQGERRFKCDQCGYITNKKVNFTRHQSHCQQGKAMGNRRLKRAEPLTENLDVKKQSPHGVYQFGSKIGEGGFGKVYEAVKQGEHPLVKYAIKEVGPKGGKSAELEAKRMLHFEHKNLMALLEYYEWKEEGRVMRFIVMECCRPGSLTSMQKLCEFQFEEPHVLYVLKEVTCGLEHLHSAGVIHRDLKSANVLVNEGAVVKIADFGVSTDERIVFNCRGTPGWEAPEVVAAALTGITGLRSAYTQKADVYSVGVMAIDCFLSPETLPTDFYRKKKVESESFAETQLQRIEDDRHLQLSKAFKTLVARCLEPMTTRLSAAAVQKVPSIEKASVEPFKLLVAECLKKQKEKDEKRSARRRKPTIDSEAFSLFSSPTPPSGPAPKSAAASSLSTSSAVREQQPSTSLGTSSLFSAAAQCSQQAPMSTGMSSYFSAAPSSSHRGQPTANTAVSSLFPASEAHSQQASTSGGMSSLFFSTTSSHPDQ